MREIVVQLLYRNYKPLHKIYESLVTDPPKNVTYNVPPVINSISGLLKLYRKFGDIFFVQLIIKLIQKYLFLTKASSSSHQVDILHYINIISERAPGTAYVVEFEHPLGLANFSGDKHYMKKKVLPFLMNTDCKAIICMSRAAKKSLKEIYGNDYRLIKEKVHVVYPALNIESIKKLSTSHKYIKKDGRLYLLFVGNDSYRKGLEELLWALREVDRQGQKIKLAIVSDDSSEIVNKYQLKGVSEYKANFSKEEIMTHFFKAADYFIMPTKVDTFGMVFLDALSASTPVIATSQFAIPEIVNNNQDGLLIPYKGLLDINPLPSRSETQQYLKSNFDKVLANNIRTTLKLIIEDESLQIRLSKETLIKFKDHGKFSIKSRNEAIRSIYEQAL